MKKRNLALHKKINAIFDSQKSDLEKLSEGFHTIAIAQITISEREQELLRALGDQNGLVKEQIKMSTLKHAIQIFDDCYQRATGQAVPATEEHNG